MNEPLIRLARPGDYQRILDILNDAIEKRRYTALLTPVTIESRRQWFQDHQDGRHPIYVADIGDDIAGWMAVTAYRDGREGFCHACEVSYYVDPACMGRGVATALMNYVIDVSTEAGLKHLMAVIFADNIASQALARKFGFEQWGRFPDIVEIDGQTKDCLQMGLALTQKSE